MRRTLHILILGAVALMVATAPVAAAVGGGGAPASTTQQGTSLFGEPPDNAVTYDGNLGVHVAYSDQAAMDDWVTASDERSYIYQPDGTNRAVIAAPADHIGLGIIDRTLGNGLQAKGYVTEISLVREVGYPTPIERLESESAFDESAGTLTGSSDRNPTGLAFNNDSERTSLDETGAAIGADQTSATGDGVTIAVLDTGVNAYNTSDDPLYQDRIVDPYNARTNESGIEAVRDGDGHGSHVAGTAAADPDPNTTGEAYEGVAPDAQAMPVKVLGDDGSGATDDIVRGIEHAEANGADVIQMSLGSPLYMPAVEAAITRAIEGNATAVIVAAGNSGAQPHRLLNSPADVEDAFAVGATNTSSPATARTAYFSSVGPDNGVIDASNGQTAGAQPDVVAPGMAVDAPVYDTSLIRRNRSLSGTSMAAPHVSGVAALTLAQNPSLENDTDATYERLRTTASPAPHVGVTEAEHGMINASNAVSNTQPDTSQADARTDTAVARDEANRRYSGSRWVRLTQDATGAS